MLALELTTYSVNYLQAMVAKLVRPVDASEIAVGMISLSILIAQGNHVPVVGLLQKPVGANKVKPTERPPVQPLLQDTAPIIPAVHPLFEQAVRQVGLDGVELSAAKVMRKKQKSGRTQP